MLFSVAYYYFCDEKKSEIAYQISNMQKSATDKDVVEAFKRYDSEEKFSEYLRNAERAIAAMIAEAQFRELHDKIINSLKPKFAVKFLHEIGAHFAVSFVSAAVIVGLPVAVLFFSPDTFRNQLHQLGEFLIKTFPIPVDTNGATKLDPPANSEAKKPTEATPAPAPDQEQQKSPNTRKTKN